MRKKKERKICLYMKRYTGHDCILYSFILTAIEKAVSEPASLCKVLEFVGLCRLWMTRIGYC